MILRLTLFFIAFLITPVSQGHAYCDVGAVTAQNANSGIIGSSFGDANIQNCEEQNYYEAPSYYPSYNNSYNVDSEIRKLELERDQKLDDIKNKFDKECKEKYTGPNSHFDENNGCVCNVGYLIHDKICKSRDEVINIKFEELFYKTMVNLPEYRDIVDKDFIKIQALNPANGKLKLSEIIKESYGDQLQKRTQEVTKPSLSPEQINEKRKQYGLPPLGQTDTSSVKGTLTPQEIEIKRAQYGLPPLNSPELEVVQREEKVVEDKKISFFDKVMIWFKKGWFFNK